MIPSIKHLMRRIIIKFNQSAFFACIIKFTVEYVSFFSDVAVIAIKISRISLKRERHRWNTDPFN